MNFLNQLKQFSAFSNERAIDTNYPRQRPAPGFASREQLSHRAHESRHLDDSDQDQTLIM